jgi:hypothetical protein
MPPQGKSVPPLKAFGARYKLGAPTRPVSIVFDNGFLDKFKPREPTVSEYAALGKWQAKLAAAEALRPDLADACEAYRHFLYGGGLSRTFSYDKYVLNDTSGATTLSHAMLDIQDGAEIIWESTGLKEFEMTGDPISCGSTTLFPYPATENWQKAIGGHVIWLSGRVVVTPKPDGDWLRLDMVLHAEDRYNFNPDQRDIVTKIPDSDNGIFEITGLAKQFTQTSELRRRIEWKHGTLGTGSTTTATEPLR